MILCPKCKKRVPKDLFCVNCGSKLYKTLVKKKIKRSNQKLNAKKEAANMLKKVEIFIGFLLGIYAILSVSVPLRGLIFGGLGLFICIKWRKKTKTLSHWGIILSIIGIILVFANVAYSLYLGMDMYYAFTNPQFQLIEFEPSSTLIFYVQIVGCLLAILWFITFYNMSSYLLEKRPNIFANDPLWGYYVFPNTAYPLFFWKELFISSYKKDKIYMRHLMRFRVLTTSVIFLGIIWVIFS